MVGLLQLIRQRPLFIAFVAIGIAIFIAIFFRSENTRKRLGKVEVHTPCLNLTKSECALKLFKSLPEVQRKRLKVSEKTLRKLERRIQRERENLRSPSQRPPETDNTRAGGASPGPSTGGVSPPAGQKGPGSRPGNGNDNNGNGGTIVIPPTPGPAPTPTPQPQPQSNNPIIKTPKIEIPGIITVPSIEVPCIEIKPAIKC